jgi:hypothetical protein
LRANASKYLSTYIALPCIAHAVLQGLTVNILYNVCTIIYLDSSTARVRTGILYMYMFAVALRIQRTVMLHFGNYELELVLTQASEERVIHIS